MWTSEQQFDNYKVINCSRASAWRSSYRYGAVITLYKGKQKVGSLTFRGESSNLQDNHYISRSGVEIINLEFFEQDLPHVLSLLQQESPLYVCIRDTLNNNKGLGAITTTTEPVGEEEGV